MSTAERSTLAALRQRGHKLTPQRRAVLRAIAGSHDHVTPAELHRRVREEQPRIGLVTVYRTLELMAEMGLVCELNSGGHRSYLLRRPAAHHHHLICSACGRVVDFTGCDLGGLERRLSAETGFRMEGHLLEFRGRCPQCQGLK